MELRLSEQLRERQKMSKKLQNNAQTVDYLERAKREESAPLIEAASQQRLAEEKVRLNIYSWLVVLGFMLKGY